MPLVKTLLLPLLPLAASIGPDPQTASVQLWQGAPSIREIISTVLGRLYPDQATVGNTVYIATNGDDRADGSTAQRAVQTLARAQEIIAAAPAGAYTIRYLPGTYYNQSGDWTLAKPDVKVTIEAAEGKLGSVVLDGSRNDENRSYFLRLAYVGTDATTVNTGLTVRNLVVRNYCEGISLGDFRMPTRNSGTTIRDNWFDRIGTAYQNTTQAMPEGQCVAGIRLDRSSNNVINHNRFTNIINLPQRQTRAAKYGPALLHAIYIANDSVDNTITDNEFSDFTGSPVRVRNRSNNVVVTGNAFSRPIYASRTPKKPLYAVSQWYCNDAVDVCMTRAAKGRRECPSENLQIKDNRLAGKLELYADESQSKISTCPATGS